MRTLVFALCVAAAAARPQGAPYRDATVVKYETEHSGRGPYRFAYETSDGQTREEVGEIRNAGTDNEILVVTGSFSFVGPDGVVYTVQYVADDGGFKPEGAHLPGRRTPPLALPPGTLGSLVGGGLG